MIVVIVAAVILLAMLVLLFYWIQHSCSKEVTFARALPTGLPTVPLLGHAHHFLFTKEDPQSVVIGILKKISSQDLRMFCFWLGPSPLIFINNTEDVQMILNNSKALHKGAEYKLMKYIIGEGLLTAGVPTWKVTRRHMTSLFHPRNLDHMIPVFNRTSQQLVHQLFNRETHDQIDIYDDLMEFAIRNVLNLMYHSNFTRDEESRAIIRLRNAAKLGGKLTGSRMAKPWLRWDPVFNFLCKEQIQYLLQSFASMPETALKHVEECEKPLKTEVNNNDFIDEKVRTHQFKQGQAGGIKHPVTLPEIYKTIRERHSKVKKEHLPGEINTIFITGTDTIATSVSNCLLVLGSHPHIQDKLYKEIVDEAGKEAGTVTSEDLKKLSFMDCVLKETWRRFTVVPFYTRTNEVAITLGDCTLPPGSNIAVNALGIHSDPRLYPDPDRFDPDRFSAENVAQRHKYAYIPFSGGPRDCIGKQYAWLAMKIVLVHLLREFKVTTTEDINKLKFSFEVIFIPKGSHRITLEKRNK